MRGFLRRLGLPPSAASAREWRGQSITLRGLEQIMKRLRCNLLDIFEVEQMCRRLTQASLRRAFLKMRILVITGAGVSAESGIPTFRGKDGYWRNLDPAKLATPEAFAKDPGLVWEWYRERRL